MTHENREIISTEAAAAETTIDGNAATEPTMKEPRRRRVAWYDFLVIMLIFLLSQIAGAMLVLGLGVESPADDLLLSERVDIRVCDVFV